MSHRPEDAVPDRRDADSERVARLEESAMFNERAVEQLNQQLVDLFGQLQQVVRRLEAMEGRISSLHDRLENPDPGPEKPPHSA